MKDISLSLSSQRQTGEKLKSLTIIATASSLDTRVSDLNKEESRVKTPFSRE